MAAYYNENDPGAAAWLRVLIKQKVIADGEVDERDIRDVRPSDLRDFVQCHFFAGIGGWPEGLRLAGWPDERPIWTGSCPCQPFSEPGPETGFADERHLWPDWFHLICELNPDVIAGEQVDAAIKHDWLDLICDDLEGIGYAVASPVLPAACVGAPQIRHRIVWLADSAGERRAQGRPNVGRLITRDRAEGIATRPLSGSHVGGFWANADWIRCLDGRDRPIEPGTRPLAHGIPARVGRLRAYGNAIVPPLAAEFIRAYMSI